MNYLIVIVCLLLMPCSLMAQYPKEVLPGQSISVQSGTDTLWIIRNRQLNQCISAGEKLKICKEITDTLKLVSEKKDRIIAELESNSKDYKEGYDRYKVKWEESDKKVEALEIKIEKQKKITKVAAIASAIGGALLVALAVIML